MGRGGGAASVWVRVPRIRGNARQEIKLHWGKADAASASDGRAVFDASNGSLSVWHMTGPVKDEVGTLESKDVGTSACAGVVVGPVVQPGTAFSVSAARVAVDEGKSVTRTAAAGGATVPDPTGTGSEMNHLAGVSVRYGAEQDTQGRTWPKARLRKDANPARFGGRGRCHLRASARR